jgi:hypothetical protein
MENFESQQFRDNLAKDARGSPKAERRNILEKAKGTTEYWQTRKEKIGERQDEEEIDNGLGIFLKKKTLYHGSGTSEIGTFNKAEETTVGHGIYLTSEAKDAIGYARRRSHEKVDASPIIYESSVEDIKLLDLRKNENVKKVLTGFKGVIEQKLKTPNLNWAQENQLQEAIQTINAGKVGAGNLRDVTFGIGDLFSEYVKSIGYEGLITFEGGEGYDVGTHDTYLVFDPTKATINREHRVL